MPHALAAVSTATDICPTPHVSQQSVDDRAQIALDGHNRSPPVRDLRTGRAPHVARFLGDGTTFHAPTTGDIDVKGPCGLAGHNLLPCYQCD